MTRDRKANLDIWNRLEVSDKRYLKQAKLGGRDVTTVDPLYNVRRVTEELGPVGFSWGWEIKSERTDHYGEGQDRQTVHSCVVRAWFRQDDGSKEYVEHVGTTPLAYWSVDRYGKKPPRFVVDAEAPKKSVTDALKKILVHLGASADIWLGRFDGDKYAPPPADTEGEEQQTRPETPRQARSPEAVTVDEARIAKCRRVVTKELAAGSFAYADPAGGTISQPFASAEDACRDLLDVMGESPAGWVTAAMKANEPLINAAGDEIAREMAKLHMRKNGGEGGDGKARA